MNRPVTLYYAATILFMLLDFVLGVKSLKEPKIAKNDDW